MDRQVEELEVLIRQDCKENEAVRKLTVIPGLGPITASAIVTTVGDARKFKNRRQLAAWLELVSSQNFSGDKQVLLCIRKQSDECSNAGSDKMPVFGDSPVFQPPNCKFLNDQTGMEASVRETDLLPIWRMILRLILNKSRLMPRGKRVILFMHKICG